MDGSCSKRAKAPGNTASSHCLVDGCNADLSLCRDYHRRHKVCEVHSKTPKVTIGGSEQRFCQQCSRFHSLIEFDEGKRSCRKRLDGHNRRRRKPQPEAAVARPGPRLLSFGSRTGPQILPSTVILSSSWPSKPENQTMMMYSSSSSSSPGLSSERLFPSRQIQFLQGDDNLDLDSDHRAPSLLSSGPTTPREFGLTHVARPEPHHHYNSSNSISGGCLGQLSFGQEQSSGKAIADSSSSWSALNFQGVFQPRGEGEGPSASGSHPTLTFMWE